MREVLGEAEDVRAHREEAHARAATCSSSGAARGFPIALEGALKLKEISYIHAEGYAAGEMKHGPIALIDEEMPVVVVVPARRALREDVLEHAGGQGARGPAHRGLHPGRRRRAGAAQRRRAAQQPDECAGARARHPRSARCEPEVLPLLTVLPLQLLAYYMADLKGTDVDQPRNLAKTVTVE